MNPVVDNNKYPLLIPARNLHKYITRDCECIIFFQYKFDLKSSIIEESVAIMSQKYPRVFCYKVGWMSHLRNNQRIYECGRYDVMIWKNGQKQLYFTNPTNSQLDFLFSIVSKRLFEVNYNAYLYAIREEHTRKMIYKKGRNKRYQYRDLDSILKLKSKKSVFNQVTSLIKIDSSNQEKNSLNKPIHKLDENDIKKYRNLYNTNFSSDNIQCGINLNTQNDTHNIILNKSDIFLVDSLLSSKNNDDKFTKPPRESVIKYIKNKTIYSVPINENFKGEHYNSKETYFGNQKNNYSFK